MVTRERDFLMLAVPEPKTEFNSLGERVFGKSSWKYRLAAHFDINVKNVQRWSDPKGNRQPPERIIEGEYRLEGTDLSMDRCLEQTLTQPRQHTLVVNHSRNCPSGTDD